MTKRMTKAKVTTMSSEIDRTYLTDPTVKHKFFPIDTLKSPNQNVEELEKKIDNFLKDNEKVAVEYTSVTEGDRLIGGRFAVYYRPKVSKNNKF